MMIRRGIVVMAAMAMPAGASAQVVDGRGDWLPDYLASGAPLAGDLDVLSARATFDGRFFTLGSTQGGTVGSTVGSLYVWAINRGAGTARLGVLGAPPAIGPDKLFDALAVLFPDGTARVVTFPAVGAPTITPLTGAVSITGDTITGAVPLALLPSTGFAPANYQLAMWTRRRVNPAADGTNAEVADFAPDQGSFSATVVPEPASWSLMVAGMGLLGGALRHRRRVAVSQVGGLIGGARYAPVRCG